MSDDAFTSSLSLALAVLMFTSFILITRFADRRRHAKELRSIIDSGRSMSATQAIDEYEAGLGLLVKNESLLPGRWWFLRNDDNRDDCDLFTAICQFGYVVLCQDLQERRAIEAYTGKVKVLLEPFDE